jgi:hypothetical protein
LSIFPRNFGLTILYLAPQLDLTLNLDEGDLRGLIRGEVTVDQGKGRQE